jgi:hypothetical protein
MHFRRLCNLLTLLKPQVSCARCQRGFPKSMLSLVAMLFTFLSVSTQRLSLVFCSVMTLTNSVAPEPTGSSPYSQGPAIGPQLDPLYNPPASLPKSYSDPILPSMPWSSKWSLSFWCSHQNPIHFPLSWVPHVPPTSFSLTSA